MHTFRSMKYLYIIGALIFIFGSFQYYQTNYFQLSFPRAINQESLAKLISLSMCPNFSIPEEEVSQKNQTSLNILPSHELHVKWMKGNLSRKNSNRMDISLVSAFEYADQIALQISSEGLFGEKVYCHYYDSMRQPLYQPFESVVFPESIIYCLRKPRTKFVSLTRNFNDTPEFSIPLCDRTSSETTEPEHFFSVCIAPMYGAEPKWLMISEFIEYYKLQGATYFYIYLVNLSKYDRMIVDDYVRTGEAEVIVLHERFKRHESEWQHIQIHNCLLRSRAHAKWSAFVDLDERLAMNISHGTIVNYLRKINDFSIGTVIFRQRWIMKTELQPANYTSENEMIKWMPTQRYTNTSSPGPQGHTTKCIIRPETIGAMWVHYPYIHYPGFREHRLDPKDGYVRHYRDLQLGSWGERWLKDVAKFGPFEETNLDKTIPEQLIKAVVKRVRYVYG